MLSPEQISLPEKNLSEQPFEQAPKPEVDSLAGLRKLLEKPEAKKEPESEVKSMTIGEMEKIQELLNSVSASRILGRDLRSNRQYETREKELERVLKEDSQILDFLGSKPNFDSNTKRKLYRQIMEKDWNPKLEKAGRELESEIELLELWGKERTQSLTEEEKSKKDFLLVEKLSDSQFPQSGVKERERLIKTGLFCLRAFGFDQQRLNELEERFKKARNAFKKALKKLEEKIQEQ